MEVELPDGTVLYDVPEGTTKAQLQAKLNGRFGTGPVAPDQSTAETQRLTRQSTWTDQQQMGQNWRDLTQGAKSTFDRAALGVKGLLPQPVQDAGDWIDKQVGSGGLTKETAVQQPDSGYGMTGAIGADIALGAAPVAKATQGLTALSRALRAGRSAPLVGGVAANAGYAAATMPEDRGTAAMLGGGGALAGPVLTKTLGGLRPVMGKDAAALSDAGITMTPGQYVPGLRAVEDRLTSIPLIGDVVKHARARTVADFGRAEINAALKPLGKEVKGSGADAVDMAARHVSDAYNEALPHISISRPAYERALNDALGEVHGLPLLDERQLSQLNGYIQLRLAPNFTGEHGGEVLSGEFVKSLDSEIGHYARKFMASPNPADHPLGEAFYTLQSHWREAMDAPTSPTAKKLLQSANQSFKALLPITIAAERNPHGTFTPAVLKQALSRTKSGAAPTPLTDAASRVLPSTVPDTGSAGRMIQGALMGGAAGVATGTLPHLAAGAGATALVYSKLALNAIAGNTALQKQFRAMTEPQARIALEQLGRAIAAQQGIEAQK